MVDVELGREEGEGVVLRCCVAVFGKLNTVGLSLVVHKMLASLQEDSRGA